MTHAPWFLVFGPQGSGISTAIKKFREKGLLTISGAPLNRLEQYCLIAETDSMGLALNPEINPFTVSESEIKTIFEQLKANYPQLQFLYLSTPTDVLLQRFAKAEKNHPYQQSGLRLLDILEKEAHLYKALKPFSQYHIDTSTTTPKELELKLAKLLGEAIENQTMQVQLTSFGFKHGVPLDAEMVFDMRFLPNPFYDETLRPQTGLDKPVQSYVLGLPETQEFLQHWQSLLSHSLPLFQQQGKTRLNIAIGCTGGQHRSVAMTMALAEHLRQQFPNFEIQTHHREQHHWPKPSQLIEN